MYHQVTPRPDPAFRKYAITPEAFGAQMQWLKGEGYAAVGLFTWERCADATLSSYVRAFAPAGSRP